MLTLPDEQKGLKDLTSRHVDFGADTPSAGSGVKR
jgi:hypothetical protein